jgi:hypothetical protein
MEKIQKLSKLTLHQETLRDLNQIEFNPHSIQPCSGVKSVCFPVCTPVAV